MPFDKDKFFWENVDQARERLRQTYVMHGDDPFYVEDVYRDSSADPIMILGRSCRTSLVKRVPADADEFQAYRVLPPLGWTNALPDPNVRIIQPTSFFLRRIPSRSRSHGLSNNKIKVSTFHDGTLGSADYNYTAIAVNAGYHEAISGVFPTIREALDRLPPSSSVAVSRKYAMCREKDGTTWFYRDRERLGLVSKDVLRLFPSNNCFREELEAQEITIGEL